MMKNLNRILSIISLVCFLFGSLQVTYSQKDDVSRNGSRNVSKINKYLKSTGTWPVRRSSSLKGATASSAISSLASSYCVADGDVIISIDDLDPSRTGIIWEVFTGTDFTGKVTHTITGGTSNASWAEISGDNIIFKPSQVPAIYYGDPINFVYVQTGTVDTDTGKEKGGAGFTAVYENPNVYDFAQNASACFNSGNVLLTLSGTDVDVYYDVYKDGIKATPSPIRGEGGPRDIKVSSGDMTKSGNYTILASASTDGTSCPVRMNGTAVVTINPLPIVTTSSTEGFTMCEDTQTKLGASTDQDPDVDYVWRVGGAVVHNGASFDVTPPVGATSYEVTATNRNTTCSKVATVDITVTQKPEVAPTYDPLCSGEELNLYANPTGGSGVYNVFAWTGVNGFTSAVQNPKRANAIQGTDDGVYSVTVTDDAGCESDPVNVNVAISTTPTPTINGRTDVTTTTICDGDAFSLTAGGGDTYVWKLPDGSSQSGSVLSINPSVEATHEGVYELTVTQGTCSNTLNHNVIINTPPATSAVNNGPKCVGVDIELTGGPGGMTTYAWTGPGGYTSNLQSPILSNVTIADAGDYTLTTTDANGCTNSATTTVAVRPKPVGRPKYDAVCDGGTLNLRADPTGGTAPYTNFSWTGVNAFTSNVENPTRPNVVLGTDDGIYTVTFEDSFGCTSDPANVNVIITNLPTPTLSINPVGGVYCSGTDVEFTAGGGDEYEFYVNGASVQSQSTDNTYNTTALNNGDVVTAKVVNTTTGCASFHSGITVTINPLPSPTLGINKIGASFCLGDEVDLTAGGGDEYEFFVNGVSVQSQSTNSVYKTTALNNGDVVTARVVNTTTGCEATTNPGITVTVNHVTATLNITNPTPPGTNVCAGTTVTFVGSGSDGSGDYNYEFFAGGVSQGAASTTPNMDITINSDVVIEVEVTDNVTGCTDNTSISMTAIAIPTVNLTQPTNGQEFCEGQAITLISSPSGYSNYVYYSTDGTTDTPLNTLGNETFDVTAGFDPSITGVYVIASDLGCSAQSATINIAVNQLPQANAGTDQVICEGDALTLDGSATLGTPGFTYNWTGPNGYTANSTEDPDLGTAELSEAGTYTLTVIDSKSCEDTDDVIVTLDPLPQDQNVIAEDNEYCEASSGVRIYLQNSEAGITYQLQDASNTPVGTDVVADGTSTVEWHGVLAGTYHVVAFGSTVNTCSVRMTTADIVITENPLPTQFNITPSDVDLGCNGGAGWPISMDGSEAGVTYQLLRNGTPYGLSVIGTGTPITLNANVTAFGVYTIRATNSSSLCSVLMNEDYEIQSDVAVTTYDITSVPATGDYCVSDATPGVDIGMSGSDATVEYQLILNGNTAAPEQTKIGDGNPLVFDNKVLIDGTYTVQIETPGGCSFPMNGSITVTAYTDPTVFDLQADNNGFYCPDPAGSPTGVNMLLSGQQAGIEYTLYRDNGGAPITIETVTGTVDDPSAHLNFTAGPFTTEDTYYVVAQRLGVGCSSTMNNNIAVTENPLLNAYNVSKSDDFCTGSTVSLFIDGSESDAEYRWVANDGSSDVANSAWILGTGTAMEFTGINIGGNYRVEVQRTENGITCGREMLNTVDVIEKPLPLDKTWITSGGTGCDNGVVITIENSELNVTYYLYKRGTPDTEVTGAEIIGDGNDISFAPIADNAANYNVVAELNGCTNDFDVNIPVNVVGAITKLTLDGGGSVCSGGVVGAVVGMSQPTANTVTYELFLADSPGAITGTSKGIITGDGTIRNFGNQTDLGEYYVMGTNTSDGTCPTEMTNRVTISYYPDPVPIISANPGNTICLGTEVTFTGAGGANYQFVYNGTPIGALSPVNTYITSALVDGDRVAVIVESADGCTAQSADMVMTVNPMPSAKDVGTTGSFCQGSSSNVSVYVTDPEAGFTYTLIDESDDSTVGTDATLPILFANVPEGTYRVEASAGTCSIVMNNSVTVAAQPLPTIYDISPTGSVTNCVANTISLSNSELGVAYTLLRDGSIVGGPTDGTHDGVMVTFGDYNITGTYSAIAENLTTGCTSNMNGTFSIAAGIGNAYDLEPADGNYCAGTTPSNIRLLNSNAGIKYTLYLNGVATTTEITSTADGEVLDFGVPTSDGSYTVIGEDTGGCLFPMNNTVEVVEIAEPTAFAVETGNGLTNEEYCPGDAGISAIHVKGQQINVTYTLYDINDVVIGTPEVGVVDDPNVDIVFTGPFAAETYHVVASNSAGCSAHMSNTVRVAESPAIRDDFEVVASGDICTGGFATITTNGSENGMTYRLFRNGLFTGLSNVGNGGVLDPPFNVNQGGTYTMEVVNGSGCSTFLVDDAVISETNLPTIKAIVSDGGVDCSVGATITVQLADPSITYQLYKRTGSGDVLVDGSAIMHTGSVPTDIDFAPIVDKNAFYTVKASNGSCEIDMSNDPGVDATVNDDVYVDIADAALKYLVTPDNADICNGDLGQTFGLVNSEEGVIYSLYNTMTPGSIIGDFKESITGPVGGGAISFANSYNEPGEYFVIADNGVCTNTMINRPTLNVNPLPTAFKMTGSGFFCDPTDGAEIGLESQEENVRYTLQFEDGSHIADVLGGAFTDPVSFGKYTVPGMYRTVAINETTFCTSNMEGQVEVVLSTSPAHQFLAADNDTVYCGGTTGVEFRLTDNELDVTYQVREAGTTNVISEVVGTNTTGSAVELIFPDLIPVGSYEIWKTRGGDACESITNGGDIITIYHEDEPTKHEVIVDNTNVCGSTGAVVSLSDFEAGRSYRIESSVGAILDTITGAGGDPISWPVIEPGGTTEIYEVFAVAGAVCDRSMGTIEVRFNESPTPFIAFTQLGTDASSKGSLEYCEGSDGLKIGIEATQLQVAYMLYDTVEYYNAVDKAMVPAIDVVIGNGSDQLYTKDIPSGVYRIKALLFTTGCELWDDETIEVSETVLPEITYDVYCNTIADPDCTVGDAVCIEPTEVDVQYTLFRNGIATTMAIDGDGNKLCFDPIDDDAEYTIMAKSLNAPYCENTFGGDGIKFSYANFGLVKATDDIFNVTTGYVADTIDTRVNDTIIYVYETLPDVIPYKTIPPFDVTDPEYYIVDRYYKDYKYLGDAEAKDTSNVRFSLLHLNGSNVEVETQEIINETVGVFKMDAYTGELAYAKTPGFFGKDSISYILRNIEYDEREDTAKIYVYVGNEEIDSDLSFLIPNAFSPNGDDINDYYIISGKEGGIPSTKSVLEIFNRWGTLVYRSKGTNYGDDNEWWDGTSSTANMVSIGADLPNGTYYFVFTVEVNIEGDIKKKEYNGYIELRR